MYFALCWKQVSCAEVPRGWLLQVQDHVDDAVQKGARVRTGGSRPSLPSPMDKGNFFSPTVLDQCTIDMTVRRVGVFWFCMAIEC